MGHWYHLVMGAESEFVRCAKCQTELTLDHWEHTAGVTGLLHTPDRCSEVLAALQKSASSPVSPVTDKR